MRGEWDWEVDVRAAWRHRGWRRRPKTITDMVTLRVSSSLAMEIQNSRRIIQIEISKGGITWQGIPMCVDPTLPPGCFIFEEGEENGND